jgi:hypothetical protein
LGCPECVWRMAKWLGNVIFASGAIHYYG